MNLLVENFKSIAELTSTLKERKNNGVMEGETSSSTKGSKDWYGTDSYEEASELMQTGYKDILPQIKNGIAKSVKLIPKTFSLADMRKPRNMPIGFIPNVPNSILNLPDSMIDIKITPQKRKTISIFYVMSGHCGQRAELWIKAGICLLTAIKIIERMGISVKIDASFYCGAGSKDIVMGSVCVKHYGQPLDIQKLCFPLANPSMFRRIGFKFLETYPGLTDNRFSGGYGRGFETCVDEVKSKVETDKVFVLYAQWIEKHRFKVEDILSYLKFNNEKEQKEKGKRNKDGTTDDPKITDDEW